MSVQPAVCGKLQIDCKCDPKIILMSGKNVRFGDRDVKVVDLFCGVGGLTHGFVRRHFDVVLGYDLDDSCQFAYETNNGSRFVAANVADVTGEEIRAAFGEQAISILIGCAPCQIFSRYNQAERNAQRREDYSLLREFIRLVEETEPTVVSMENVPDIENQEVFTEFVGRLEQIGYSVDTRIVHCPDYGVPQGRRRLVLLASRLGELHLIDPTRTPDRYRTVRSTIGRLTPLVAGAIDPHDPVHTSSNLSPLNLERILASREGGSWRDWPEHLRLDCHTRDTGRSYGSVYGRMRWDAPSPTITTQCNGIGSGRFGHPEQNRAISLREAALLQSFPRYYRFIPEGQKPVLKKLARHIGNAVPFALGRAIAMSIERHLEEHHGVRTVVAATSST